MFDVMLLTVSASASLLVSVTSFGALVVLIVTLPNWSEVGENTGAESVPVPCSAIVPGLLTVAFLALLVMLRLPVSVPCADGVKVTPTVQLSFAARMVEPARLQGFAPMLVVAKLPVAVTL